MHRRLHRFERGAATHALDPAAACAAARFPSRQRLARVLDAPNAEVRFGPIESALPVLARARFPLLRTSLCRFLRTRTLSRRTRTVFATRVHHVRTSLWCNLATRELANVLGRLCAQPLRGGAKLPA
eukprot:6175679-Pleurochrysis_carterae.AAC.2